MSVPSSWRARRTIAVQHGVDVAQGREVAGRVEQRRQLGLPAAAGGEGRPDPQGEQLDPLELGELVAVGAGRPGPDQRPLELDRGGVPSSSSKNSAARPAGVPSPPVAGPAAAGSRAAACRSRAQCALHPPSITSEVPVTDAAAGEHR